MDHHLNQWRSRPFQGSNVCPICSISHFPFCPSFDQNPRFSTPQNQPFFAPGIDVIRSNLEPRRPGYVESRMGGSGIDGGFGNYDWSDEERSRKRFRVDEIGGLGSFYSNGHVESNANFGRVGFEEERRLKLIHEHGVASACQQNGGDLGLHQRPNHVSYKMPNMAYPIGAGSGNWNGNGSVPMHHGHSYGNSGVSPVGQSNFPAHRGFAPPPSMQESNNMLGRYPINHAGMNMSPQNVNLLQPPPPLPLSPPPPIPMEPSRPFPYEHRTPYQSSPVPSSLFPAHLSSSPGAVSPSFPLAKEHHAALPYVHNRMHFPASSGQVPQTLPNHYRQEKQPDMLKPWRSDKPKVIDAVHLFKQPHRATRPDHIVIILRGLPGSGKSYLAKMLRDIEVENGGQTPRIHSMDEYFMTEVEKPEEIENSKSASSSRGKKTIMKKVMEYCYEPEMEEAYRSSMLKAFKKSLEVGEFTFIIVDDRNLRVAHFAQFWATAKTSGYEVYLLEAPYKDPAGCAARNVHNLTQDDIEKMAGEWEEAPSMYLQLDVKSLSHGDNLKETGIEEVDMDMEDETNSDFPNTLGEATEETGSSKIHSSYDEKQEDDITADQSVGTTKELGQSKWSNDLDEEDVLLKYSGKRKSNESSGSVKANGKKVKTVRWGDQAKDTGFSIGAAKKSRQSLVIGPGRGYNSTTNPIQSDDAISSIYKSGNKKSAFQERLRAEHEMFKDVFAKRKQKLGFVLQDE